MNIRALVQNLSFRHWMMDRVGRTFGGKRDIYKALGYKRIILLPDYRQRYQRNGIANRVVKALPNATWRGGCEVVEDQDPTKDTAFEQAFDDLAERLKFWDKLRRTDVLAGIGRYAILVIGAPGELDTPLEKVSGPDDIKYLQPYCEEDATIQQYNIDNQDPRFGLPIFYSVKRTQYTSPDAVNSQMTAKRIHYSRVLHVSDGLLDDNIFGEPRLECIWNDLDDLDKVRGGGAEAFWRRADQGRMFDLDPELELGEPEQAALEKQIQEYEHGLRRNMLTRGMTISSLGSDVADFGPPVLALIGLICGATGIPQRVLLGSEQGKLAAKQDRGNWDDRVSDRREAYADPMVARPLIERLIELGALPEPQDEYEVRFPELKILDDDQRADVANKWASVNHNMNETVVTPDEIRERVLDLPPLKDVMDVVPPAPEPAPTPGQPPQPKAASGKGGAPVQHVVADRFRRRLQKDSPRQLRRRKARARARKVEVSSY